MGLKDKLIIIGGTVLQIVVSLYMTALNFWPFKIVRDLFYGVPQQPQSEYANDYLEEKKWTDKEYPWLNHGFINTRTAKLHYVYGGDESKPLMLFVHGFPEFWFSWRYQLAEFRKDYFVVAIDMRGYNLSSKPQSKADYTINFLQEDIEEVVRYFRKENCILVAHDWGGVVAWSVVLFAPHIVSKFVAMNIPYPSQMMKAFRSNATQLLRSWYIFFFQLPFIPEFYLSARNTGIAEVFTKQMFNKENFSKEDTEKFRQALSRPGSLTAMVNYYRNIFVLPPRSFPKVKSAVPTLMIWGEGDVALGKELTYGTEKYFEEGKFTIHYVPNCSHWVQQDAYREVNSVMREWLVAK